MKRIKEMRRNGMFLLISMGLLLFLAIPDVSAWSEGEILTSSPWTAPIIDGQMGDDWRGSGVNNSFEVLEGNRQITLYVLHNGSNIYFMVRLRYSTTSMDECVALYISKNNSLSNDQVLDRKAVFLTNASAPENRSVTEIRDYHRNPDPESETTWLNDSDETIWNASAGSDDTNEDYRIYEFQIPLSPSNTTEDVKIEVSQQYAVFVGISSNHNFENEVRSNKIVIQVGPSGLAADEEWEEFKIDPLEFITVMVIIIAVVFGMWGILLGATKSKVGSLSIRETEDLEEPKQEKDTKEKSKVKKGGKK